MVSRRIRNFLWLVCFTALLLFGCDFSPSIDQLYSDTTNLTQSFSVIEQLKLVEYGTGAQELFHYKRGIFSRSGRTYFDGATGMTKSFPAFDRQADQDLNQLEAAIDQTGIKVIGIVGTRFNHKGTLVKAEFKVPSNFIPLSYVYSPGYRKVPAATAGQQVTPIDSNWYFRVDDWN